MTKKERTLSILVILQTLAILLLIGCLVWIRSYVRTISKTDLENYLEDDTSEATEEEKTSLSTNVSANLVWWDQDNGFESIKENSKYINSISPFWYELDINGKIQKFSGAEDAEVLNFLKANDIKITPVISNEFKAEPLATIIATPAKKNQHINDLVELAKKYDGISLNYENLSEDDRDNYTSFVSALYKRLKAQGKTLTVHLHAKTKEPGTWGGPKAQDWKELAKNCDNMKIMAYDYHWATSEAGAIAPPDWVEDVIKHALTKIPKDKIVLGIPFYGYDWVGEIGEGLTYTQAQDTAKVQGVKIKFDSKTKSPYFTYTDNEKTEHEVWFENAKSTKYKLDLAKKYNLGGIDFWRLGEEDANSWDEVENVFKE